MTAIITAAVVLVLAIAVSLYACCIVAGRCDRQEEQQANEHFKE